MSLSVCLIVLFAAELIQAAPQSILVSSKRKALSCNQVLTWDSVARTVVGLALPTGKIPCPEGFVAEGTWDRPRSGANPQCCIEIPCGGVQGRHPGFCTTKGNCHGSFAVYDPHTCPGLAGIACCFDNPKPPSYPIGKQEESPSAQEAIVNLEQSTQAAVLPDGRGSLPLFEVPTTQPPDLYSNYPTLLELGSSIPQANTPDSENNALNAEISTHNLGFTSDPEKTFQAFSIGADVLECTSPDTCSETEVGIPVL